MIMKNLIVRAAVFGMGCALCFGTAGCGTEYAVPTTSGQMMQKPISAENAEQITTQEQEVSGVIGNWEWIEFTVKGETTKREDIPYEAIREDGPHIVCEDGIHCLYSNAGKQHTGTIREENGQYIVTYDDGTKSMIGTVSGDVFTLVNEKGTLELILQRKAAAVQQEEEKVPAIEVWDEDIEARYVASYVITEEKTAELLKAIGKEDRSGYFTGMDSVFDVVMDLKDDGSAVMYYDIEGWSADMKDNLESKFYDTMIAKYEEDGISREELEKQMIQNGYKSLEDGLDVMKRAFLKELDPMIEEVMQPTKDIRIHMTGTKEGDTLYLEGAGHLQINDDGSFDYRMPAAQSIAGEAYDLHFVPVNR